MVEEDSSAPGQAAVILVLLKAMLTFYILYKPLPQEVDLHHLCGSLWWEAASCQNLPQTLRHMR